MGEGTGNAAPKTTLRRPKALRLISTEALGRSSRLIFMLAWCADAHDVYFENKLRHHTRPLHRARADPSPRSAPRTAFSRCVVCAHTCVGEHNVYPAKQHTAMVPGCNAMSSRPRDSILRGLLAFQVLNTHISGPLTTNPPARPRCQPMSAPITPCHPTLRRFPPPAPTSELLG